MHRCKFHYNGHLDEVYNIILHETPPFLGNSRLEIWNCPYVVRCKCGIQFRENAGTSQLWMYNKDSDRMTALSGATENEFRGFDATVVLQGQSVW